MNASGSHLASTMIGKLPVTLRQISTAR